MTEHRKTIAVDFDGVIHRYSKGWQNGACYDEPMDGARVGLRALSLTYRVVVFTARQDLQVVREWMELHDLWKHVAEITNQKPAAFVYLDDRAVRFEDWEGALDSVAFYALGDPWKPVVE